MKSGHLELYPCKLRILSPLFIGNGQSLTKREYYLDNRRNKIGMINLPAFSAYLERTGLADSFEQYLLSTVSQGLAGFCRDNRLVLESLEPYVDYWLDAGAAGNEHNLRDVHLFMKDRASGQPYIPGSSIKGAMRTAICAYLIHQNPGRMNVAQNDRHAGQVVESILLRRLGLDSKHPQDAVNDIMRGLRISDSYTVSCDCLTLANKIDRHIRGNEKPIPLYRECLMPGTELDFTITLEPAVLSKIGLSMQRIQEALALFDKLCYESFTQHFDRVQDADTATREGVPITLGGGSGYIYKTFSYPLYGKSAVKLISSQLSYAFRRHGHDKDVLLGISPHTDKKTCFRGQLYPMGRCELLVEGC